MILKTRFPALLAAVSLVFGASAFAATKKADVAQLSPGHIREFDEQPESVQQLLRYALSLTKKNLRYQYGSCDPKNGGMDCSGTVFHILTHHGIKSPRASNTLYLWVEEAGNLRKVRGAHKVDNPQLRHLKPGDLLFWEGTYNVGKRNPPTSHVMIFVGHRKSDGKPVAVGASSGRYYGGKARHGVSVFDFRLPRVGSTSKFVGYGPIPGLETAESPERDIIPPIVARVIEKVEEKISGDEPEPAPVPQPQPVAAETGEGRVVVAEMQRPDNSGIPQPDSEPESDSPKLGDAVLERIRRMEAELDEIKGKIRSKLP